MPQQTTNRAPTPAVLSMDMGLRDIGWALTSPKGALLSAGLAQGHVPTRIRDVDAWLPVARALVAAIKAENVTVPTVAYEQMTYRDASTVASILQLAGVTGAVAAMLDAEFLPGEWRTFLPEDWKGQVPKAVYTQQLYRHVLSPGEIAILDACLRGVPGSLRHNVIDAVGIGMAVHRRHAGGRVPRRVNKRR